VTLHIWQHTEQDTGRTYWCWSITIAGERWPAFGSRPARTQMYAYDGCSGYPTFYSARLHGRRHMQRCSQ
jgi:hypothetical protein